MFTRLFILRLRYNNKCASSDDRVAKSSTDQNCYQLRTVGLASLAVRWYPHRSPDRRWHQGWRRPARTCKESLGPRLADRGSQPPGSGQVRRSPGGRLPSCGWSPRWVEGVAWPLQARESRPVRGPTGPARGCTAGRTRRPATAKAGRGSHRWELVGRPIYPRSKTQRQNLRPMPSENVSRSFRKSPARRSGLASIPLK